MVYLAPVRGHYKLDLSRSFVVSRDFRCEGRVLSRGDSFDWKRYGIDVRKVRQFFDNRLIDYAKEEPRNEPVVNKDYEIVAKEGKVYTVLTPEGLTVTLEAYNPQQAIKKVKEGHTE